MPRSRAGDEDDEDYEDEEVPHDEDDGGDGGDDDDADYEERHPRTRRGTNSRGAAASSSQQTLSASQGSRAARASQTRTRAPTAAASVAAMPPPASSATSSAAAAAAPAASAEAVAAAKTLAGKLAKLKVPELKDRCKEKSIPVTRKNKAELVAALVGAEHPDVDVSAIDVAARPAVRVTHQPGGSRAGWRVLQPFGQAQLVHRDTYASTAGPRIGGMLQRLHANAKGVIDTVAHLYPNVSRRLAVFVGLTRHFSELVMKKSRANMTRAQDAFNGVQLLHALGTCFITNLSSLPLDEKWPSEAPRDFTKEIYLRVVHTMTVYGARTASRGETRPTPKVYRPTRVAFWENTGRTLRLAIILAHPRVTLSSGETPKRATCSWCGVMRKLKVRLACALCGEEFCDVECFVAFHTILDFPTPDETGSASGGAAEGGPGADGAGTGAGGAGTGTGAMGGVGSGGAGSGAAAAAAAVGPVPLDLGATSEDGDEESEDDESGDDDSGDDDSGDDASDDDDASSPRDRRRGVPAPARGRAGATSSRGGRPRGRGAVKRARRRS